MENEFLSTEPHYIDFEEVKILSLDFSGIPNDRIIDFMEKSKAFIKDAPAKSILFLVNVSHLDYSTKNIRDFSSFSRYNDHFSMATAILGMDSLKQTLYNVALSFSDRDRESIKTFKNEEAAKDWLKNIYHQTQNS